MGLFSPMCGGEGRLGWSPVRGWASSWNTLFPNRHGLVQLAAQPLRGAGKTRQSSPVLSCSTPWEGAHHPAAARCHGWCPKPEQGSESCPLCTARVQLQWIISGPPSVAFPLFP